MTAYAGFWRRTGAFLVDLVVLVVATGLVGAIAIATAHGLFTLDSGSLYVLDMADWLVVSWLYFSLLESSSLQGTLGKRLLGMVVVDRFGRRISFARATARYLSKYLSHLIFDVGFLMVAFSQRKQGLHDMIADTFVVRRSRVAALPEPGAAPPAARRLPGRWFALLVALPAIVVVTLEGILVVNAPHLLNGVLRPTATLDGMTWERASVHYDRGDLRAVVAGGPGFVAGGPFGVVTSADGRSWEPVADDRSGGVFEAAWVTALTMAGGRLYAGGTRYPAVGTTSSDAAVWVSADGERWALASLPQAAPPLSDQTVVAMASGPSGLVAAGYAHAPGRASAPLLWYSPDGRDWRLIDLAAQGALAPGDQGILSVAGTDHGYAVLLARPVKDYSGPSDLLASPDGQHWARVAGDARPGPTSNGGHIVGGGDTGESSSAQVVASDGGRLLAAGLDGGPPDPSRAPVTWVGPVLWQSGDGSRWSAVAAPQQHGGWPPDVRDVLAQVRAVARSGDVLWAAGSIEDGTAPRDHDIVAAVWASADGGRHWSALPGPFGLLASHNRPDSGSAHATISGLAVHDGVIVAVGDDGGSAVVWRAAPAAPTGR